MRVGSQAEMQSVVSRDSAELIRSLPGIERDAEGHPLVSPELLTLVNIAKQDGKSTNVQVRGTSQIGMELRPSIRIVEGRTFRPGTNEAIVSKVLPTRIANVEIGKTLKSGSYRWQIVGYFDLQAQSKRPIYSIVYVRTADRDSAQRYIEAVKGDQRLKFEGKTEKKYFEEQMVTGAPIKILAILVGVFTAIGASFGAMNTMYAQVSARIREIGTLRAIGFSRRSVLASFVLEALILSLIGGVLGTLLAFVLFNLVITKPTGTMNFRTFSEILFNFRLTPPLVAGGIAFSLAMGLVGGFFPAARAARLKITTALREI
jgi:putative ABC transport system permease protein